MQPLIFLKNQNVEFLQQGCELIERLDDAQYRATGDPLAQSGIGSHFRHILDFYDCFSQGVASGRIDYDARSRNRAIETERKTAISAIEQQLELFERLPETYTGAWPLEVSSNGPAGENLWSRSTLLRELQVLIAHTVHHYALIAVLLRSRGIEAGDRFGVAPSSLRFEEEQGHRKILSSSCRH